MSKDFTHVGILTKIIIGYKKQEAHLHLPLSGILKGWFGGFKPHPKFRSFDKAGPNSQCRGKYIHNNLIRIRVSLI
jgi:hypothetical protein